MRTGIPVREREAKQIGRQHGFSIRYNAEYGEWRVNLPGAGEASAYYTDDRDDAIATGKHMAEHRNSYGTVGGCERHNRVNCSVCEPTLRPAA